MTVAVEKTKTMYEGNGVTVHFPIDFAYTDKNHIIVSRITKESAEIVLTEDYFIDTVSNTVKYPGYASGQEVPEIQQPPILPIGEKLLIYRKSPLLQEAHLPGQELTQTIEGIGDHAIMCIQELNERVDRSVVVPITEEFNGQLPSPLVAGASLAVTMDGKRLRWGANPDDAGSALVVAKDADVKSTEALSTANGIDAKATEALFKSNNAVERVRTLEEHVEEIDLGNADTLGGSTKEEILKVSNEYADKKGLPVGSIIPFPTTTIPPGYLECNGAEVGRATYEELFNVVGTIYGEGDGLTTFNLPDYRGEFLRGLDNGRGVDTDRIIGSSQSDAVLGHMHGTLWLTIDNMESEINMHPNSGYSQTRSAQGVYTTVGGNGHNLEQKLANSTNVLMQPDKKKITANENRPRNIAVVYAIKAFDGSVNEGLVDVTEMANDIATNSSRINDVDNKLGFAIIYPNGGTEASPANVSIYSVYYNPNPFPGYHVICEAQCFYEGKWSSPGFVWSSGGHGVSSHQLLPDDTIQTAVGTAALAAIPVSGGGGLPVITTISTPMPCRVLVWKVGKI